MELTWPEAGRSYATAQMRVRLISVRFGNVSWRRIDDNGSRFRHEDCWMLLTSCLMPTAKATDCTEWFGSVQSSPQSLRQAFHKSPDYIEVRPDILERRRPNVSSRFQVLHGKDPTAKLRSCG